jgi:hypothetical protein
VNAVWICSTKETILKQEGRSTIMNEDKATLQKIFANQFKAEEEKDQYVKMLKSAIVDITLGVLAIAVFVIIVFLPAIFN